MGWKLAARRGNRLARVQAEKTDPDLLKVVTNRGEDMPPFGRKLTKEQIEGLIKNDVQGFAPKKKGK